MGFIGMFALAKCVGFAPLFQKWAGLGAEPHNTPFLFDNFFFAAPSDKEKVAMEVEKLRGYSRFKCANPLPAFLFETRGTEILVIFLQIDGVQPSQNLQLLAFGELERLKS